MSEICRPRRGRLAAHPGIPAAIGLAAAAAVMLFPAMFSITPRATSGRIGLPHPTPGLEAKAAAAMRTLGEAETVILSAKAKQGVEAEVAGDFSGLIGSESTPLVTTLGNLEAKRTATNPLWAAVLTRRLAKAGIGPGDVIAAGFSGSFPGLNLAVMAAAHVLGAELVAVSSVTASTWGADQPGFTWPEIECRVVGSGLLPKASVAVTSGGDDDNARELEPDARAAAGRIRDASAACLGAVALRPSDLRDAIAQRLAIYRRAAAGRPVALYINVGGTSASLGRSIAVLRLRSGFAPPIPFDRSEDRGVIARFAEERVRILTLLNIRDLAIRWGVPLAGPMS